MIKAVARALVAIALAAGLADAQATARISGVVRDSANRPLGNTEVDVMPARKRVRTDSAGRFDVGGLEGKQYILRARRVGYVPVDWTVEVPKGGHAEVQIILGVRLAMLDTVRINEARVCDPRSYEGFLCRRSWAKGQFVDYVEIDTMQVYYSADLLRDLGGFNVTVRPTGRGATRVPYAKTCTIVLMNGVEVPWHTIPEEPYMISAIEVYKDPKDIPKEFRRFTWNKERCWLVAYWTYDFMMKPITIPSRPRPYRAAP